MYAIRVYFKIVKIRTETLQKWPHVVASDIEFFRFAGQIYYGRPNQVSTCVVKLLCYYIVWHNAHDPTECSGHEFCDSHTCSTIQLLTQSNVPSVHTKNFPNVCA